MIPMTPTEYSEHCVDAALDYMAGVMNGEVITGKLVRLAVERHIDDMVNGEERHLYFDEDRAIKVFKFFSLLKHWKGEWAGQQFVLSPWQCFIVWCMFGWVNELTGWRRFTVAYLQVGRKNGKTIFAAGIGLYLFAADGEAGAEVYSAATKRDQARISHKDALMMRALSKKLTARTQSFKDNLSIEKNGSKFEPLGANADTTDGLNPSAAIIDEMHKHKDRELWDVIEYGMGARRQPLIIGITTAGDNPDGMCYEIREHCAQILDGTSVYDSMFAFVAEPDANDDWSDQATWIKGNPNLGVSVKLDRLVADYEKAKVLPSAANNFRRYRLDQWVTGGAETWLDMEQWAACIDDTEPDREMECFGGLDLASTQDVACFALWWPEINAAKVWSWLPSDNIDARSKQYRVPLTSWADKEWLELTPGNVIDYAWIRHRIGELASRYSIKEIGYDDWNSTQIVVELMDSGLDMVPLQQTVKTYTVPMNKLSDMVTSSTLVHYSNPLLRWMASNVHVQPDPVGRIRPIKAAGKRRYKIDGIVAVLMAIARSQTIDDDASVYSADRGLRVI